MKTDLRPGRGDDPQGSLRAVLRSWDVPGPPADLEEDLRREFRRRRPHTRRHVWLALAAGLAVLAVWQLTRRQPPSAPSPPPPAVSRAAPALVSPAAAQPDRTDVRPVEPTLSRRRATVPARAALDDAVVVEPSQRELLVAFAESLHGARQAPPAVPLPPVEVEPAVAPERTIGEPSAEDVARHHDDWKRVAGAWPFVHLSVPSTKR